ncbi:MAG: ATP-binding cassette domain-containing protein [Chlamydia sp.]
MIHDPDLHQPMIILNDVWKSFNGVHVLQGLSLSIPKNGTTVILGRSGVGKSVTLKLLLGIEDIDKGKIIIDGCPFSELSPKKRSQFASKRVGMLFQSSALFDSMTIGENVAFTLQHIYSRRHEQTIESEAQIVDEALEKVGLSGYQNKYPSELSGGQKRRAALARLFVYKPKIILFDEPTTGLDPVTAHQINMLIIETQKALQATCIVVTHDLVSAMTIGDHFALHHAGGIALFGDKRKFFTAEEPLLRVFIESAMMEKEDRSLLEAVKKNMEKAD